MRTALIEAVFEERLRGGRADGRERQIALLPEQFGAEPHGVRAHEDDEIEILDRAQPRGERAPFAQRFDLDCGEAKGVGAACFQQAAQRPGLLLGPLWAAIRRAGY